MKHTGSKDDQEAVCQNVNLLAKLALELGVATQGDLQGRREGLRGLPATRHGALILEELPSAAKSSQRVLEPPQLESTIQ